MRRMPTNEQVDELQKIIENGGGGNGIFVAQYGETDISKLIEVYDEGNIIAARDNSNCYYYLDKVSSGSSYLFIFRPVFKAEISGAGDPPIAITWGSSSAGSSPTGKLVYSYNAFTATGSDPENLTLATTSTKFNEIWNRRGGRNIYLFIEKSTPHSGTYILQGVVIAWSQTFKRLYFKIEDPIPTTGQNYSGVYAIYISSSTPTIEKIS